MSRDLDDDDYYISHGGKIPIKWTSPEVGIHVCRYTYNACMCVYVLASWQLLTRALSSIVVRNTRIESKAISLYVPDRSTDKVVTACCLCIPGLAMKTS